MQHLLTIIILLPLAGALAVVGYSLLPGKRESNYKWVALITSLVEFAVSLFLIRGTGGRGFSFSDDVLWIGSIGAHYHVGVDGISLWLVLLTTLLMPIAILSSWTAIQKRQLSYYMFLLLLLSAMVGVFVSLDLLLFYLFFEASLVPMFFLIGIWGGERRIYAAIKFFIYTAVGSLLMLVGIIALYYVYSTFDYTVILAAMQRGETLTALRSSRFELVIFGAFALAFCIKVPLFPFHTWLPDAHVQAPTAGSVILAGVLLKMGTYGFVRFAFPLFPEAASAFAPYLATLAVIGIIYGALVAMVQPDMKKLVAYSSVSHLGFVVLGIAAMNTQGMQGAVYQMLNHGISTGGLFLIVGMLSDRRHTRLISEYGGLKKVTPQLVAAFLIVTLSSIGLPGLNGFVGEFLILLGAFAWNPKFAAFAATGVILSATYMLWMFQRVNYGPVSEKNASLPDLNRREWVILVPVIAMAVLMGVLPNLFLRPMAPSIERMLTQVRRGAQIRVQSAPATPAPTLVEVDATAVEGGRR